MARILKRHGLNRRRDLEPAEPVRRYERASPVERLHMNIKKLAGSAAPGHRVTGDRTGQRTIRDRGLSQGA